MERDPYARHRRARSRRSRSARTRRSSRSGRRRPTRSARSRPRSSGCRPPPRRRRRARLGHTIEIEVRPVQGAYMLGEETVLLKALEGKRGQPEQRPPQPATRGLFGWPTVVQNVQTLAAVPWILATARRRSRRSARRPAPARSSSRSAAPAGGGVAEVPIRDAAPGHRRAGWQERAGGPEGDPRRRAVRRDPARGARRHGVRVRCPPRRRRARRLRVDRRGRHARLRRRPGPPADPVLRRRGVRQDDPLPDRSPPGQRDRRPDRDRPAEADRPLSARGSVERHRRVGAVRPRALATLPFASGMRYFQSELDEHILRSRARPGSAGRSRSPRASRPLTRR